MREPQDTPTIWCEHGRFYWSTLEPHPNDPDPSIPAGPFQSLAEAVDDCADFFNTDEITPLDGMPDRFRPAPGQAALAL